MSRRNLLLLVSALAAVLVAWLALRGGDEGKRVARGGAPSHRSVERTVADELGKASRIARTGTRVVRGVDIHDDNGPADGMVSLSGTVTEAGSATPVADVEVVFLGPDGETAGTTAADGTYRVEVPVGTYRAFVRGDSVLSVGIGNRVRIPGAPSPDDAGAPAEDRMPLVFATSDLDGVDLGVVRSGTVVGTVVDGGGKPVTGAVVRALGRRNDRSALNTDVSETDATGHFEIKLPAGLYYLDVTHARYAAVAQPDVTRVMPAETVTVTLAMARGCIISGRVVAATGKAAGDGAIERQYSGDDVSFAPMGRIEPDGTFRWSTLDEGDVTLRAWPWKSPPAPSQRFACRDGARFDNVVFRIPDRRPDLEGVLVDHDGKPVAFAHVDLVPLDPGGIGQQERTDGAGHWAVYALPAGRYQVSAMAPARGVVTSTVTSPQAGVKLALGGTGRLEGTVVGMRHGTFELEIARCLEDVDIDVPRERRFVRVEEGAFAIDGLPACQLGMVTHWRGSHQFVQAIIKPDATTTMEIDLEPKARTIDDELLDPDEGPL